jgi:predicted N-acetyltransferase YhbS
VTDYEILTVEWPEVGPFLEAILRTPLGEPPSGAAHVAAFRQEVVVAAASIHPEGRPGDDPGAWRLGAIAVEHGQRGRGLGGALLERCLETAGALHGGSAWCRVPAGAFGFFSRYGFRRVGDPAIGPAGPEYVMAAAIRPARRSWALPG